MSPEAQIVRTFLARARRRSVGLRMIRATAAAFAIASLGYALTRESSVAAIAVGTLFVAVVAGLSAIWPGLGRLEIARTLEQHLPVSRNLILTAAEIFDGRVKATPAIATRVFEDTRRVVDQVSLSRALPALRTAALAGAAIVVAAAALFARHGVSGPRSMAPDSARLRGVTAEIIPPQYSGRATATVRDPQRVEALAESRIRVHVKADAATARLETVSGSISMTPDGAGFTAEVIADGDGFISIVPVTPNGTDGQRQLIGLSVTADRTPVVRVHAPGRDMVVPNGQRTLQVSLEAEDDLGLASVRLRYTRISGSGENFAFTEGEVPVAVTQTTSRTWNARAEWALGALRLEPGDMLIYRGVATDRRPGAPAGESDAFIVEVAAPGAAGADGFAIDDREDRYALSQQMVVVKTERLLAKRKTMTRDDVLAETLDLAAEQRQVRAEFVFMMGGELADAGVDLSSLNEEVEAAGEEDLAAGRLANQGRLDILRAIRSMSRAASKLADGDASAALPLEKEALNFLQRAFSKSRYILRTLGARERLDLSRRLTGVLAALGRDHRPESVAPLNPRAEALRRVLAQVAGLDASSTASQVIALAQETLRIDPGSGPVKEASARLTALSRAIAERRDSQVIRAARDEATIALSELVRHALPAGPAFTTTPELANLAGALADALRTGRRE